MFDALNTANIQISGKQYSIERRNKNVILVVMFITGATTEEVALMNGLTVNLHLLMVKKKSTRV